MQNSDTINSTKTRRYGPPKN